MSYEAEIVAEVRALATLDIAGPARDRWTARGMAAVLWPAAAFPLDRSALAHAPLALATLLKSAHAMLSRYKASPLDLASHVDAEAPVNQRDGRLMSLGMLAPDIQKAILERRAPAALTAHKLLAADLPITWAVLRRSQGVQARARSQARADAARPLRSIFTKKTGYVMLDRLLARLHARKAELLRVLDCPDIPLHTNGSENDIRSVVTKRKISGGAPDIRGQAGSRASRDAPWSFV